MKETLMPTPKELTLDKINSHFASDDTAREYLELILWPHGAVCPHCKNADAKRIYKIQANPAKKIRAGLHRCAECNKEFTVTIGTIFEDSHIPLRKWLVAAYMICSSKKGISSLQLQRNLGLGSYRTALFMTHRIRHALKDPMFSDKLSGTIEADETYVGGKTRGNQFEILSCNDIRTNDETPFKEHGLIKDKDGTIKGKPTYVRIVIKRKQKSKPCKSRPKK
jgi:transposase-like protein